MINSLILRLMSRLGVKKAVFAYCCVIVDPPCNDPPRKLFMAARTIPVILKARLE